MPPAYRTRSSLWIGFCLLFCWAQSCLVGRAATEADFAFFEQHIRPLLVSRCYECHGAEKQKGNLRLDSRAGMLAGGDRGPVLVAGDPANSLLLRAVSYAEADLQMPPKTRLPEKDVALLRDWIQRGAPDPRNEVTPPPARRTIDIAQGKKFWAYQRPQKPSLPNVRDHSWPRQSIDRFVLAKIETAGIAPAPDADRAVLLRRLHFDLIGLPPEPDDIDRFVADSSPEAVERVVDRLLSSPQFGERWGRHWLDVVRFAESVTLRGLIFKEAWRYRDYVIDAINNDMPYNQFIQEQVAGDLLGGPTLAARQRRLVATTFLALGNWNLEEQDKVQLRMDVVDEQLDTLGKAFLAQTIGCARCHDHKFDPIPTRDYYALAGILRNCRTLIDANVSSWVEQPIPVEPPLEQVLQKHEARVAALKNEIKALKETLARGATSSVPIVRVAGLPGIVVDDTQARKVGEWRHSQFTKRYVGNGYLEDRNEAKGTKTLTFQPEIPRAGLYEVRFAYTIGATRATTVPVTIFSADGEKTVLVNQQLPPPLDGHFISLGHFRFEANNQGFVLVSTEGTSGHVTADAVQFVPPDLVENRGGRPGPARGTASGQPEADAARRVRLEAELKELVATGPKRPMAMSVTEEFLGNIPIHLRGSVHTLGETVPRGFLQVASWDNGRPMPGDQSGRRELAQWLSDPNNPLTARVMVNRVWHWLFGAGLVRTTDNFGTTGETPSHPELLDYLAVRFVEEGWSLKQLVRTIVASRTYQVASQGDPTHGRVDPENRLRAHMERRRLEAECLRDAMLAVSGQLQCDMGGPTVSPVATADYNHEFSQPRRSVYVPVLRNALPEMFELFDFPDPSLPTGTRNASTVAPQALFLLNHPFVLEQAEAAARRLLQHSDRTNVSLLELAYRRALGRSPSSAERTWAMARLESGEELEDVWTEIFHALFASVDFRTLH